MKCAACPLVPGPPCVGECPGCSVLCELVAAGDASAVQMVRHKAGRPCPAGRGDATLAPDRPAPATPRPTPAPAARRTKAHTQAELVRTNAFYCRECGSGCRQSRCLAGRGDEYGRAPLGHCVRCILSRPPAGPRPGAAPAHTPAADA